MKRVEQRYRRLFGEGFPSWEARWISRQTDIRLTDPALKELRKERRRGLREARKIGVRKSDYTRQIGLMYRAEGLYRRGRYHPVERVEQYRQMPRVRRAIREERIRKETPAGYEGRRRILLKSGFFDWEARILARMKDIHPSLRRQTFTSKPWQAMIKNHAKYMRRMLAKAAVRIRKEIGEARFKQLTKEQVARLARQRLNEMLRRAYEAGTYSPFSWLKREYKPRPIPRGYQTLQRRRATRDTNKLMSTQKMAVAFWD